MEFARYSPAPNLIFLILAFVKCKCVDPAKWHEWMRYVLPAIRSS